MADFRLFPWPIAKPFPESQRASTAHGPDFPGTAGDREQGKFRPSKTPRLDVVAVANDDGSPIGVKEITLIEENNLLLKGILFALSEMSGIKIDDLLASGQ